jgi:hypothetical protein
MFRPDCHANLDDVPVDEPCPSCGGSRRSAEVQAGAALAVVAALDASVSIGYNPDRPWPQKWRDVKHGLEVLEGTYAQNDLDNEVVRRQVEDFFKDCREMADWLNNQAGKPQAMSYVNTDADLNLCDAMAQTTKHHTRTPGRNPDPITAWIATVHGGKGVQAEIEWKTISGSRSGTEDALDLAQRCVAAWKRFFQQHGLDPTA